jgi:hypothetical protein
MQFNRLKSIVFMMAVALSNRAQAQTVPNASALPRLVGISGFAKDTSGNPVAGAAGITFSLYAEQSGGTPLWSETQNVWPDPAGHYTALLGATKSEGLPAALFTAERAHWVGVSIEGQPEQNRILLVSAPYALKAGDAETLGGLPPSAFLMAAPGSQGGHAVSPNASPASTTGPAVATGTADFIPLWTDSSGDLGNSVLYQSGSGATALVGINTTTPASTLDVEGSTIVRGPLSLPPVGKATASAGQNSQPLNLAASVFNSGIGGAVNQTFQWQAEPVGNDTSNHSGTLNLLFASGKATPAETGLSIASNGKIVFSTGQTFPGTGTITGVTAGTGLTGGGTSGNITLNLDTTQVPQLAANNTFTGTQTVNGTVAATFLSGNGAGVANVNASELGGLASSALAKLASSNTFTAAQIMKGTNSSGVLQVTNTATSGQAPAIVGTTGSTAAAGIKGIVAATSGTEAGIVGSTSSPHGFGVYGFGPNVGVYGYSAEPSQLGAGSGGAGVWGDTGASGQVGVQGTSDAGIAGLFENNSGEWPGVEAINIYSNTSDAVAFGAYGPSIFSCLIYGNGNLTCLGAIQGVVPAGEQKVSVYAMESAENWFEDAGGGQLVNGVAHVTLDPTFAQTVNTNVAYRVFLTPGGDCKGLYVSQKSPTSFEVHELGGGTSNIAFDYRIMAKRSGFENVRLADVTAKYQEAERHQKDLQARIAEHRAAQH